MLTKSFAVLDPSLVEPDRPPKLSHPAPAAWLWGADPEAIPVRTMLRCYRLGGPADAASGKVLPSMFDVYRDRDDGSEDRS